MVVYVKPPYPVDVDVLYIVLVLPSVGPGGSPLVCLLRLLPAPVSKINNLDHIENMAVKGSVGEKLWSSIIIHTYQLPKIF